jgi:hypothetical protein
MLTTDEVERELHRRFSEQVYVGMRNTDYLSALAHVIIRYAAEQIAAPCEYEARPMPHYMVPVVSYSGPDGAWCRTHGWYCPHNQPDRGRE